MIDRRRSERGSLLVVLLILMVPLASLAGAVITLGSRQTVERDADHMRSLAMLNAESGIDAGLARLVADPDDMSDLVDADQGGSVRYQVEFELLGGDGLDNDADGDVDEDDEDDLVQLTSAGGVNVAGFDEAGNPEAKATRFAAKRVRAFGRRSTAFPTFPFAVYLGDPNAEIDLNGNAFLVSGHDTNPDLSGGPEASKPGIATTGDPDDIIDQLSHTQQDNIIGEAGWPSVHSVASFDIDDLIATYKSSADIKFAGSASYTGNLGDYGAGDFKVTYAKGNLKISGGGEGAGILLVEGNLEVTGGWEYVGVVIVTGQVVFRGGGGGKRVIGAVLAGGDVLEASSDEDLELSGTVDILYSSKAQKDIAEALSSWTLFAWQEL